MDGQMLPLSPVILGKIADDKSKKTALIYGHFDSDNYWPDARTPPLTWGLRGFVYFKLTISGPARGLHPIASPSSSYASPGERALSLVRGYGARARTLVSVVAPTFVGSVQGELKLRGDALAHLLARSRRADGWWWLERRVECSCGAFWRLSLRGGAQRVSVSTDRKGSYLIMIVVAQAESVGGTPRPVAHAVRIYALNAADTSISFIASPLLRIAPIFRSSTNEKLDKSNMIEGLGTLYEVGAVTESEK
ncbi:hypothetical protein B0H17DRAFT_1203523 [Mycena rosella]|uniref:Uncharacterized protein n=1 Tax=Mycena rosella TaxID=1033263 RepID=A0AAD7GGY8_MYCRO|nr:hypothetical protein B0H17DRAFT_1203523 [Mycena rosella]